MQSNARKSNNIVPNMKTHIATKNATELSRGMTINETENLGVSEVFC